MIIAPSILTANFANLADEIKSISSAKLLHLDIMDGHFVPNISFGPHITKCIGLCSKIPLDVHLMVTDPLMWIEDFSIPSVEYITIHVESHDVLEAIQQIKKHNKKVGISLRPATPIEAILPYINMVDLILVMAVNPGFGGQSFMESSLEKIRFLKELKIAKSLQYLIQVDGGINAFTANSCKVAGADILVVGSYLFNSSDRNQIIKDLSK